MRKITTSFLLITALLACMLSACAERKGPTENEISTHAATWVEPVSSDFHGKKVERDGAVSCQGCHGLDLAGALDVPSCTACHDGAGGHPFAWMTQSSDDFHARIVQIEGPTPCKSCHGEDHRGGWSDVSCYTCHAMGPSGHPDGWLNPGAPSAFHGNVARGGELLRCRDCHGLDLRGGTSGRSCFDCHG